MFQKRKDLLSIPNLHVTLDGATDVKSGQVVYRDTANGVVKPCTSGAGDVTNIFGVVVGDPKADALTCQVQVFDGGPLTLWLADCTSDTNVNQLFKAHALTDADHVANTASHVAGAEGVFIPVQIVGAVTSRQLLGYFVATHQTTA